MDGLCLILFAGRLLVTSICVPSQYPTAAHDIHQMHSTIKHEILHALVGYLPLGETHFLHFLLLMSTTRFIYQNDTNLTPFGEQCMAKLKVNCGYWQSYNPQAIYKW